MTPVPVSLPTLFRRPALTERHRRRSRNLGIVFSSDVLIAITVVIVFAAAGFGYAYLARATSSTTSTVQAVATMVSTLRNHYGQVGSFAGIDNTAVINLKAAPSALLRGGALMHKWNGAITVAANAGSPQLLDVTFAAVPSAICVNLGNANWGSDIDANLSNLTIAGTAQSIPPAPGALSTACSSAATVAIVWSFFSG